jgi:two-component system cell cycle sensor histidine kinase PleC
MISGTIGGSRRNSLMSQYATLLGEAVLRSRTRIAEHTARIEAELASRVKSEFISNMSHELRTPLNTIIGFSKLLCEAQNRKLEPSDVAQYAHLIQDAAGHLLAIINDILDISKIQSGRYTLDSQEADLDELLSASLAGFEAAAKEAGVTLEYKADANLRPVRGDAAKLKQVFANLIGNAIKFTRSGGAVGVHSVRLGDGSSAVLVRDTGIGMSEEEIRIAQTPFGQVDGGRSRWREGTGLGLPIAKALVELHGGRIEIKSEKGVGTEVAVILPSLDAVSAVNSRDDLLGQMT